MVRWRLWVIPLPALAHEQSQLPCQGNSWLWGEAVVQDLAFLLKRVLASGFRNTDAHSGSVRKARVRAAG